MNTRKNWTPKNITLKLNTVIIITIISLSGGLFIGINWKNIKNTTLTYLTSQKSPSTSPNWHDLDEVYEMLKQNYDGELIKSDIITGAKKGLVESLGDNYTNFMDKSESEDFSKSLHGDVGAGVGIEMGIRDNLITVLRTLPDNPAGKAGILAGDILYKVNDEIIDHASVEKVANKVRGKIGTEVKLTIIRKKAEKTFTLKREKINNVSAYLTFDNQTAIITVNRFDENTGNLVQSFANEIKNKNTNKIILDLRNNGGGYVSSAVSMLSLWLDNQKILLQKSKHKGESSTFSNSNQAHFANIKTIVLVNGASASASEIVAGALKDYQKATIVGEKTYGKGVVQSLFNLGNGETLKITTARWYTPFGNSINKTGIVPNHVISRSFDDINAGKDPQLDFAKNL